MLEKGALMRGGGGGGGGGAGGGGGSARRFQLKLRQHLFIRSLKSKLLLLSCCAAFVLLLFTADSTDCHSVSGYHSSLLPPGQGYTVLINTWKRNDLVKKSISHYASCHGVESIRIIWSEPDPPSQDLLYDLKLQASRGSSKSRSSGSGKNLDMEIKFQVNQEDSLNNRFKEISDLRTDAVFSVDDDVLIPCASMELAFTMWRSAPSAMVGFVPRMHWLQQEANNKGGDESGGYSFRYGGWWSVWWTGTYSMVLSKASFIHKKYLHLYSTSMPAAIRDYVTQNRNCEDVAMSFLVANQTGSPPIWIKGKVAEIGTSGISSMGGHKERRTQCLNDFAAIYGYMPLQPTTVKAIDSTRSWLW